jgi:pyruvate dehydrogenase E2 component (dihydrolipoamide acetyltransferase)
MAVSVVMPALEMAQETGKLLAWRKQEGETVTKGEPLLEIETDKVVIDLEAPADGVLAGVKQRDGAVVPVGEIIAWIVAPGEKPPADAAPVAATARATQEQARPQSATAAAAAPARPADGATRISPKARRLAEEHGLDISTIRGTGPGGTITGEDVLAAAKQAPAKPAAQAVTAEAPPLSTIARLMAERTAQAWTTVPHFFLTRDVDAGALVQAREATGLDPRPTHTDLLVAIVARVLKKHPKMNASWTGSAIRLNPNVNISIAIAVKDGVVGAVIPNADTADLRAIATRRRDLAERAKSGRLHPPDVEGGTFTISNLGMYNVDAFQAIITPPQAAILAVGRIADRVVPVNSQPSIRPMMTITLSSDHRVVDGAQAALFLNDLAQAIEAPHKWLS